MKKLASILLSLVLVAAMIPVITGAPVSASAADTVSTDVDSPAELQFGTTYNLSEKNYYYFHFTLSEEQLIAIDITPSDPTASFYCKGYGTSASNVTFENYQDSCVFKPGDYTLTVECKSDYTLKVTKGDLDWGDVSVVWNGNTFTATYIPAGTTDKNNYLGGFDCAGATVSNSTFSQEKATASATVTFGSGIAAGWKTLTIRAYNPDYGKRSKEYTFKFAKEPAKVSLSLANMTVSKNSIKFSGTTSGYGLGDSSNGDKIAVQIYENGEWVTKTTFESGTTGTLSGLEAGTAYKVRVCGMVSATDTEDAILGTPSSEFTVKTGTEKPAVKSVKISGAKYKYVKKVWHSGYWDSTGYYRKGYYTGGYYKTTYKVTVTLKNSLESGQKLVINGDVCKGSGKTYTLSTWTTGKKIGKKVTLNIRSIQNTKYKGYSDILKKKVVVRK